MAQDSKHNTAAQWNRTGGNAWVALQGLLDGMFRPIEHQLAATVAGHPGARVLDVGCGSGATTVAAARAAGADGPSRLAADAGAASVAVGVDVSQAMVDSARERAAEQGIPAEFIVADAQTHAFSPGAFDLVISRFGVMFFSDPVAAFSNLRSAAAPGAQLEAVTWRGPDENPFMTAAERATASLLPDLPERRSSEPGQFGLAEPDHVRDVLTSAGWQEPTLAPLDFTCEMTTEQLAAYASQLGPVGSLLQTASPETRAAVLPVALDAFAPYTDGDAVRFTAACWTVRAFNA